MFGDIFIYQFPFTSGTASIIIGVLSTEDQKAVRDRWNQRMKL